MYVVLYQPEIPQNTGNIIRLCANVGCGLILIEPLGFILSDKHLKRAGLDYHADVVTEICADWDSFCVRFKPSSMWALSTKAQKHYTDCAFSEHDFLLFGPETRGLPDFILQECIQRNRALRIPMVASSRSLNLSNSVGIVVYEAQRQLGFFDLY